MMNSGNLEIRSLASIPSFTLLLRSIPSGSIMNDDCFAKYKSYIKRIENLMMQVCNIFMMCNITNYDTVRHAQTCMYEERR